MGFFGNTIKKALKKRFAAKKADSRNSSPTQSSSKAHTISNPNRRRATRRRDQVIRQAAREKRKAERQASRAERRVNK